MCIFRMTTGLDKLVEAAASVDVLKKELEVKEQEIKEATAKAEEVIYHIAQLNNIFVFSMLIRTRLYHFLIIAYLIYK